MFYSNSKSKSFEQFLFNIDNIFLEIHITLQDY